MRPVLAAASDGEVKIGDVVQKLAKELGLTSEERDKLLPSGLQPLFSNRVKWAKSYLKEAALVKATRRGHYVITDRGRTALQDPSIEINNRFLAQFPEFREFKNRTRDPLAPISIDSIDESDNTTPDESLRRAHQKINEALAADLIDRVRDAAPEFFETLIVNLLLAMGYGGSSEDAGRALGQSADDGVDGVIDQDPLGVDQIYVQAKRYKEGHPVGPGAIRDFFGALSLKRATKGIFVTTSTFSSSANDTARGLGSRIVLIDGNQLAKLMIRYNIGCRNEEALYLKKIDEDFFDTDR